MSEEFLIVDFPALLIVCLSAILCALAGSFLILQRQAMLVDALSHSILPGIVLSVVFTGVLNFFYLMTGAVMSSLFVIYVIYILRFKFKVEQGAAIAIVYTTMFALGIVILELMLGSKAHLDTQHVLYGALELSYWSPPLNLQTIPTEIPILLLLLVLSLTLTFVFFKELSFIIFDPLAARLMGAPIRPFYLGQMILTSLISVMAFQAVGSILVISLFIAPAAIARLLTNKLSLQLILSMSIACTFSVIGYFCASILPLSLGYENSLNAAAMIATCLGIGFVLTILVVFIKKSRYFNAINTVIS